MEKENQDLFNDLLDDIDDNDDVTDEENGDSENQKVNDEANDKTKSDAEKEKEEKLKQEEELRKKNKDAEEARKRREAEEKAKKEKKDAEEKAKKDKETSTNKLGKQIDDFTKKYPNIDLKELDKDSNFKKYISGQLLGKKSFINLYEEYSNLKSNLSGKKEEDIHTEYEKKKEVAVGSLNASGENTKTGDIYSEEEIEKISKKLPFMNNDEVAKIMGKFEKSIDFYSKK